MLSSSLDTLLKGVQDDIYSKTIRIRNAVYVNVQLLHKFTTPMDDSSLFFKRKTLSMIKFVCASITISGLESNNLHRNGSIFNINASDGFRVFSSIMFY